MQRRCCFHVLILEAIIISGILFMATTKLPLDNGGTNTFGSQLGILPDAIIVDYLAAANQQQPFTILEQQPLPREPQPRPPLHDLVHIDNDNSDSISIVGNVQWLLSFAIVGFPKCGTTTMMFYVKTNDKVQIFDKERCAMGFNRTGSLVRDLYRDLPVGEHYVRGIKCPRDLESSWPGLDNYDHFFPHTAFLIGVRHPIHWFESFYNFRLEKHVPMPHANQLIGPCHKGSYFVCTYRANFHLFLANLGKTNVLEDVKEQALFTDFLLRHIRRPLVHQQRNTHRKVFLYDVEQLGDTNETRSYQFRKDLQTFLDLSDELPPMIRVRPGNRTENMTWNNTKKNAREKLDICLGEYSPLRQELLKQAVSSSTWIQRYFLNSPDVTVSSRDYFEQILLSWTRDPCLTKNVTIH